MWTWMWLLFMTHLFQPRRLAHVEQPDPPRHA
jgi:hypothetical protein